MNLNQQAVKNLLQKKNTNKNVKTVTVIGTVFFTAYAEKESENER